MPLNDGSLLKIKAIIMRTQAISLSGRGDNCIPSNRFADQWTKKPFKDTVRKHREEIQLSASKEVM